MASSSKHIAAVAAAAIREVERIVKDTSVLELALNLPDRNPRPVDIPTRIVDDPEGKLNEVYASAGTPSSLDPGLRTLQAYSLDVLRKDDWTRNGERPGGQACRSPRARNPATGVRC